MFHFSSYVWCDMLDAGPVTVFLSKQCCPTFNLFFSVFEFLDLNINWINVRINLILCVTEMRLNRLKISFYLCLHFMRWDIFFILFDFWVIFKPLYLSFFKIKMKYVETKCPIFMMKQHVTSKVHKLLNLNFIKSFL